MMSPEDFESALLSRMERTPFQPFQIELTDGYKMVVKEAKSLSYLGGPTAIFFGPKKANKMFHLDGVRSIVELVPAEAP